MVFFPLHAKARRNLQRDIVYLWVSEPLTFDSSPRISESASKLHQTSWITFKNTLKLRVQAEIQKEYINAIDTFFSPSTVMTGNKGQSREIKTICDTFQAYCVTHPEGKFTEFMHEF